MPEYLAPGVYVEEVSYRAKSIEGVSTTTTGFVGPTRFGPVEGEPELLTSFSQFERIFGGLDPLAFYAGDDPAYNPAAPPAAMTNYLAHAVRAFFDNGGRRLYVARTFRSFAAINEARRDAPAPQPPLALPQGVNGNGRASALIPAPASALAGAETASIAAVVEANAALSAAQRAAGAARTAATTTLTRAIASVRDALPDGTALPPIDVNTAADPLATIDGVIGGLAGAEQAAAQAARDAVASAIGTAVSARDAASAAQMAATAEAPNVAGAIAAGRTAGDAAAVPVLDTANTTAAGSTTTANTRASEANAAATAASAAQQAATSATSALTNATDAEVPARANDAASAANDAATAAGNAVTAATNARTEATNVARDARIVSRAANAAAVGTFRARFPGVAGNLVVRVTARLGQNVLSGIATEPRLSQVQNQDLVYLSDPGGLFIAQRSGETWTFDNGTTTVALAGLDPTANVVRICVFSVEADAPGAFAQPQVWNELTVHAERRESIRSVFASEIPNRMQELETPLVLESTASPVALAAGLMSAAGLAALPTSTSGGVPVTYRLSGGNDGSRPTAAEYTGRGGEDETTSSGLRSFEDLEEISIVAAPGLSYGANNGYANQTSQATQALITHCERMRYRVAVLDSPDDVAISQVRDYRAILDTTRAALYYPWVRIQDPVSQEPIHVPPSGFVAGIYARNDIDRGVHKAPANEVVRGAIGLETLLNKGQQDVLNPLGINCLRFFENRGIRVWGARTLSSDPEWKYLNIRRYFAYLERSIEKSTQWAVFEPNGEALWANVRRAVEDFLYNEWKSEHLAGTKPAEAYFVLCDRTTMTQNDLDNGRMICLIGVAPLYPAEFVIFRIGQWTADRRA